MARIQLHIRAKAVDLTNWQAKSIEQVVKTLGHLVTSAGGEFAGDPDVLLDASPEETATLGPPAEVAVMRRPKKKGRR